MTVANQNVQHHVHLCAICHENFECTIEDCPVIEMNIEPVCEECEAEMDGKTEDYEDDEDYDTLDDEWES